MRSQKAFTIVELLIVIVVIAILAAITVVAFNGIQSRARASQLSSSLYQAAKKLELYKVDNTTYPLTGNLASAGITNSSSLYYQYTSNGTTYNLTASTGGMSYNSSNSSAPASGAYAGHVSGGVVTNLSNNPSMESDAANWSAIYGTGGNGTLARMTDGGVNGSAYMRVQWSAAPSVTWGGASHTNYFPVTSGQSYSASIWVRTSTAQQMRISLRPNTYLTDGDTNGTSVTTVPNTWTLLTVSGATPPTGATTFSTYLARSGSGSWQAGNTLDLDALMITSTSSALNYADGSSTNWSWSGTTNNSTSSGPPV